MKKVLQIIKFGEPEEIVKEIDLAGRSEREVEKIDRGANINLNHEQYYTLVIEKIETDQGKNKLNNRVYETAIRSINRMAHKV